MNVPVVFNPLKYPAIWGIPRRVTDVTSWHGHIPFAFAVISLLEPDKFVELGTHKGDSYFSFCQAIDFLGLPTQCFAVDTWQGDHQAGYYNERVYQEVKTYNRVRYKRFSNLLKMSFDEALSYFEDGTIDLLHIDGLHTYEAVAHDFYSWLPKLSNRGVVMLHDIAEYRDDFGVWKLWKELEQEFPSFSFTHSHGLGIVSIGTEIPQPLRNMLNSPSQHDHYRGIFEFLSKNIKKEIKSIECSIVIFQYEELDPTISCIELLMKYVLPHHSCEIIVVGDTSLDDSKEKIIASYGSVVTVVSNLDNVSFAESRNYGAAIAKGKYIVFLDNYTSFDSDWLAPMMRAMQDSIIGIVGAKLLCFDGAIHHAGVYFAPEGILPIDPRRILFGSSKNTPQTFNSGQVPAVIGACLLIERDLFWNIGGYDEEYVTSFEDIDLCLKVRSIGKGVWFEAQAELIHFEGQTRDSPSKQQGNLQNLIILNKKWIDKFAVPLTLQESSVANEYGESHSVTFFISCMGNLFEFYQLFKSTIVLLRKGDRLLLNLHFANGVQEFIETIAKSNHEIVSIVSTDASESDGNGSFLSEYREYAPIVWVRNANTEVEELRRKIDYIRVFTGEDIVYIF